MRCNAPSLAAEWCHLKKTRVRCIGSNPRCTSVRLAITHEVIELQSAAHQETRASIKISGATMKGPKSQTAVLTEETRTILTTAFRELRIEMSAPPMT